MEKQVFYENMPCHIKGFTKKNDDGSFTIFINSRHAIEQQKETYEHEIRHIENGDFDNRDIKYADIIETYNHNYDAVKEEYKAIVDI